MGAIANHPKTHEGTLQNLEFYPELSLKEFQEAYDVDTKVDKTTLQQILSSCMMEVNDELKLWKENKQHPENEVVYQKLEDIPADQYGEISELVIAYKQAVYSRGKASVLKSFGNFDLTGDGNEKWEGNEQQARFYESESTKAVRKIKDKSATTVSLI